MNLVQEYEVSRQLQDPFLWAPLPPVPWFVQRPRGGVWVATGANTRSLRDGEFHRDVVVVVDQSEGAKYVRPGSRLYREWEAQS